ncbi:MAG: GNAT family N-acetyltransferase [Thiohalomonadaceae bacterium]
MEFACYHNWEALPASADALFAQTARDSIFFSRPWFENLHRHAPAQHQQLRLACVLEGTQVLAILPLEMRSEQHWYALTNLYSSLYTLLLADDAQQAVIDCLALGLSRLPFRALRLDPIAADDPQVSRLEQAMVALDMNCQRRFRFYNWIHRTNGQRFEDYLQARPARLRNTLARKQRKLSREHGYMIRLYTDRDLPLALQDYDAVYQKSWKANELYGEFIEGLTQQLAEQGWLRLAILYIKNQPVAAQFWFVVHGRASIFKLVYDQQWGHYSPGSILSSYLMAQVIDNEQVSEIDFLTGNDSYKQDWMSERRERQVLYCIKQTKPKRGTERLREWLRGFIQRVTTRLAHDVFTL